MFERYTEGARRALFFARYEASQFGSLSIEPEHLLLGLLRDSESGLAGRILKRARVRPGALRREVESVIAVREKVSTSVEIPFSVACKEALLSAATAADIFLNQTIDTEHLLLGILQSEGTPAASILMRFGMSLQSVREAIVMLRAAGTHDPSPPKEFNVLVQPTRKVEPGMSSHGVPGEQNFEGFTVREVLFKVYGVHQSRIQLPSTIDETARYDVTASWPSDQHGTTERDLIRFGIEHFFDVTIAQEAQLLDVYVLTAPEGTSLSRSEQDFGGFGISFSGAEYSTTRPMEGPPRLGSGMILSELSASNATMEDLCHNLEGSLDRLVVDETNLDGRFDLKVRGNATTIDELRHMLRTQLGLVLTPAQRNVMMLVVRATKQAGED